MIMLACDLDNTLIYRKPEKPNDYTPIEYFAGKPVTYISKKAFAVLENLDKSITFVPVTARSIEEYKRIDIFSRNVPSYAITSLGGSILKKGEVDEEWNIRIREITGNVEDRLNYIMEKCNNQKHVLCARIIDGCYLFLKSREPVHLICEIERFDTMSCFDALRRKEKVYVIPKQINKWAAVKRVQELLEANVLIAAGDSDIDIPMLNCADYALIPSWDLATKCHASQILIKPQEDSFDEFIFKFVNGSEYLTINNKTMSRGMLHTCLF